MVRLCLILARSEADFIADGTPFTQINGVVAHPTLPLIATAHEDKYIRLFDSNTGPSLPQTSRSPLTTSQAPAPTPSSPTSTASPPSPSTPLANPSSRSGTIRASGSGTSRASLACRRSRRIERNRPRGFWTSRSMARCRLLRRRGRMGRSRFGGCEEEGHRRSLVVQ